MAFMDIPTIENEAFYIDTAFGRARAVEGRDEKGKELDKLNIVKDDLVKRFEKILRQFPRMDELDPFYMQLAKIKLDVAQVKKSLGAILWAVQKVKFFHKMYDQKIKRERDLSRIKASRREFYGRIGSVVKQIKTDLIHLREARKTLVKFPSFKTGMTTVCIVGFPNVGKTTLLSKITGSKGDIQPYAFTTQSLNLGYWEDIQFIDTPGTLNRDKQNDIELLSELAMIYLADAFIYVFDGAEASMPLEEQKEFYERIKKIKKPLFVYVSKKEGGLDKYNPLSIEEIKKELEKIKD